MWQKLSHLSQLAFKRTDSTDLQDMNNKAIQQLTPSYNAHLTPASNLSQLITHGGTIVFINDIKHFSETSYHIIITILLSCSFTFAKTNHYLFRVYRV